MKDFEEIIRDLPTTYSIELIERTNQPGSRNRNRRKYQLGCAVVTNEGVFSSVALAAAHYNIPPAHVYNRINSPAWTWHWQTKDEENQENS